MQVWCTQSYWGKGATTHWQTYAILHNNLLTNSVGPVLLGSVWGTVSTTTRLLVGLILDTRLEVKVDHQNKIKTNSRCLAGVRDKGNELLDTILLPMVYPILPHTNTHTHTHTHKHRDTETTFMHTRTKARSRVGRFSKRVAWNSFPHHVVWFLCCENVIINRYCACNWAHWCQVAPSPDFSLPLETISLYILLFSSCSFSSSLCWGSTESSSISYFMARKCSPY